MLSYRHSFHAGNFADVLKHLVLIKILKHLNTKDKPFCCIDTHAGAGGYQLNSDYAQKNKEFCRADWARHVAAISLPSENGGSGASR